MRNQTNKCVGLQEVTVAVSYSKFIKKITVLRFKKTLKLS